MVGSSILCRRLIFIAPFQVDHVSCDAHHSICPGKMAGCILQVQDHPMTKNRRIWFPEVFISHVYAFQKLPLLHSVQFC